MFSSQNYTNSTLTSLFSFRVIKVKEGLVRIDCVYSVSGNIIGREVVDIELSNDGDVIKLKGLQGGMFVGKGLIREWKRYKDVRVILEDDAEVKITQRKVLK